MEAWHGNSWGRGLGVIPVNRAEFQQLADDRISDATALLAAQRWSGAYYLAGYAIECALKSCVVRRVEANIELLFQDRKLSDKCWTHNIQDLVKLADLEAERDSDIATDPALKTNWAIAKDWSEVDRYRRKSQNQAEEFIKAVNDKTSGVLPWIKTHW